MENIESSVEKTINKTTNALVKELETLNDKELHDLFIFFYQINHQQYNTIKAEKFIEFLESFKSNPFRKHEDKASRKELIENLRELSKLFKKMKEAGYEWDAEKKELRKEEVK
jgi:hypothetical protein